MPFQSESMARHLEVDIELCKDDPRYLFLLDHICQVVF